MKICKSFANLSYSTTRVIGGLIFFQSGVSDMAKEEVVQPFLVSSSMLTLATETVRSILKIDDVVNVVGRG